MKKTFSETAAYPVIFMLVITIIFVGILAVFYRNSMAKIEANKVSEYNQLLVELLSGTLADSTGIDKAKLIKQRDETIEQYIKPLDGYSRKAFQLVYQDKPIAYLFDIKGKGLWGSMAAMVATDTEFQSIIEYAVYAQMETPGLGSRITEPFFKEQFKGKAAITSGVPQSYTLVPEGQEELAPEQIRQVTGATITSNSVLKMLADELKLLYSESKE